MLGLMLQTLDIGFVYFYGGLTPPQKARALDTIKTRDDIKVMVSLVQYYPTQSTAIRSNISNQNYFLCRFLRSRAEANR